MCKWKASHISSATKTYGSSTNLFTTLFSHLTHSRSKLIFLLNSDMVALDFIVMVVCIHAALLTGAGLPHPPTSAEVKKERGCPISSTQQGRRRKKGSMQWRLLIPLYRCLEQRRWWQHVVIGSLGEEEEEDGQSKGLASSSFVVLMEVKGEQVAMSTQLGADMGGGLWAWHGESIHASPHFCLWPG